MEQAKYPYPYRVPDATPKDAGEFDFLRKELVFEVSSGSIVDDGIAVFLIAHKCNNGGKPGVFSALAHMTLHAPIELAGKIQEYVKADRKVRIRIEIVE